MASAAADAVATTAAKPAAATEDGVLDDEDQRRIDSFLAGQAQEDFEMFKDEVAADTGTLVVEEPASIAYDAVGTKNTLRHAIAAGDEERVRHLVEYLDFGVTPKILQYARSLPDCKLIPLLEEYASNGDEGVGDSGDGDDEAAAATATTAGGAGAGASATTAAAAATTTTSS